jgi:hypothetical protein
VRRESIIDMNKSKLEQEEKKTRRKQEQEKKKKKNRIVHNYSSN